jgi:hypothetical protein
LLLDNFAREIARQDDLHLARHGFSVNRAAILKVVSGGSQEEVFLGS